MVDAGKPAVVDMRLRIRRNNIRVKGFVKTIYM